MPLAVLLFFEATGQQIGLLILKCLLVLAAFAGGYLGGMALSWAADRYVFARKSPEFTKRAVRWICGVGLAVLVAVMLFKGGGGGDGLGGGPGLGAGAGAAPTGDAPAPAATPNAPKKDAPPPDPKKLPPEPAGRVELSVQFLSGADVTDGQGYLLVGPGGQQVALPDGRKKLRYRELLDAVERELRAAGDRGAVVHLVRLGADPLPRRHDNIENVENWLRQRKVGFDWPEDANPAAK